MLLACRFSGVGPGLRRGDEGNGGLVSSAKDFVIPARIFVFPTQDFVIPAKAGIHARNVAGFVGHERRVDGALTWSMMRLCARGFLLVSRKVVLLACRFSGVGPGLRRGDEGAGSSVIPAQAGIHARNTFA
ncbi:MAG: hypothetical protein EAZ30_08770 [Betaproteobacteria bacterium]|nr:MAG: hypothetical protein EAZ30_08770 [Betaproteobacteria bacterium]